MNTTSEHKRLKLIILHRDIQHTIGTNRYSYQIHKLGDGSYRRAYVQVETMEISIENLFGVLEEPNGVILDQKLHQYKKSLLILQYESHNKIYDENGCKNNPRTGPTKN